MDPAGTTEIVRTKPQPRRGPARAWLVAGLVLACAGWSATPVARAGCAHDVATRAEAAMARAAGLDRLAEAGALSGGSWRISPLDRVPARPCSGFGCSRDSRPPMTTTPALPRIDAWGRLELAALVLREPSSPLPPDGDSPRPLDRVDRLARPPRP